MVVAIQRLKEDARAAVKDHFLALPTLDRSLRFGVALGPQAIAGYVDAIDFDQGAVFGALEGGVTLVGVAHLAFMESRAELGLSVLPAHRRRGIAAAMFGRAVAHSRNRGIARLCIDFLSGNAAVMRLARRYGMNIVTGSGSAHAHLDLQGEVVLPRAPDAPVETHWTRILFCDFLSADACRKTPDSHDPVETAAPAATAVRRP
jgi:GNAT superfamily N-acetyltransferase